MRLLKKSLLVFLLVAGWNALSWAGDKPKPTLEVSYDFWHCSFTITLRNKTESPILYYDAFKENEEVPPFTLIYVKNTSGEIISGAKTGDSTLEGYTIRIFENTGVNVPVKMSVLKPGETVEHSYKIDKLATGLFDYTKAQRKDAKSYTFNIVVNVYLDENLATEVKAATPWKTLPLCL